MKLAYEKSFLDIPFPSRSIFPRLVPIPRSFSDPTLSSHNLSSLFNQEPVGTPPPPILQSPRRSLHLGKSVSVRRPLSVSIFDNRVRVLVDFLLAGSDIPPRPDPLLLQIVWHQTRRKIMYYHSWSKTYKKHRGHEWWHGLYTIQTLFNKVNKFNV